MLLRRAVLLGHLGAAAVEFEWKTSASKRICPWEIRAHVCFVVVLSHKVWVLAAGQAVGSIPWRTSSPNTCRACCSAPDTIWGILWPFAITGTPKWIQHPPGMERAGGLHAPCSSLLFRLQRQPATFS